jgi:hypothetical protein
MRSHLLTPEKLAAQAPDKQGRAEIQFLRSLLRRRGGWFANHGLRLLVFVPMFAWGTCRGDASLSPADSLKGFVAAPPPISDLRFIHHSYPAATNFAPEYIRAACQSEYYALAISGARRFLDPDPLDRHDVVAAYGRWSNYWWNIPASPLETLSIYTWHDQGVAIETNNQVLAANTAQDFLISSVFNIGAESAPIASIVWNGDAFALTNRPKGVALSGSLHRDNRGFASALDLTLIFQKPPRTHRWRIEYSYSSPPLLGFFPSSIVTKSSDPGKDGLILNRNDILRLTTNFAIPKLSLEPSNWYNIQRVRYQCKVSGTNLVCTETNGKSFIIGAPSDTISRQFAAARQSYYVWAVLLAALPILGALLASRRNPPKNPV